MSTHHNFTHWILLATLIASTSVAADKENYFSAQDLERECRNKSEICFGVIYGVQGTLLSESSTNRMRGVVCLPNMSADDIRIHFLSYAIDRRKEITGMLGASALFTMLYDKYPCVEEAKLRKAEGEAAAKELLERVREKER